MGIIIILQYSERHKAWNNRKSLKGGNVWVKEDYPNEIEERRKVLYPYLRGAYQGDPANPQAKISAYMKYDKLVVNNQTFNHTNIMYLPEYIIRPYKVNSMFCVRVRVGFNASSEKTHTKYIR